MSESEGPMVPTRGEVTAEIVSIGLSSVPYAGGVLSGVANSFIQKRQNRRLNEFLKDLADDLAEVKENINQKFVTSDEFEDLTEDIFSKAAESRQKEKLDAFRAIFVNTITSERANYDEAAEIVTLINSWQPRHIVQLKILSDPVAADSQRGNVVGSGGGISTSLNQIFTKLLPDWDEDQIERTWSDLYDAKIHRTSGTKTMMTDKGIHQLEGRLTEFGQKVARYLSN